MNWAWVESNSAKFKQMLSSAVRFHPYAPHLMVQTLFILCRVPNPDSVLAIHTPSVVFSARSLLENRKGGFRGSRLGSLKKIELLESSSLESSEFEPLSAAKCRIFKRLRSKVICGVQLGVYNLLFYRNDSFSTF